MQENINKNNIRVRFAPAPTGTMHLGNVRTALINYLFARQKQGTFILRVEDTDPQRNFDPEATRILSILAWLGMDYDEGPIKGGPYAPYFQSKRSPIYKESLEYLINNGFVYRCFCTQEELERKRNRQIALKQPPRYDRTCLKLSESDLEEKLKNNTPFIWRVKIDQDKKVSLYDMARGTLEFDLKNFSDFPITREDGSFTFAFANCIDDITMKMTHVLRGEDHLTNTVDQIVMYHAFNAPVPIFLHLPIICDVEGKKLSKRNFGFSILDLKDAGYLPEAITNYLAIIGTSFEQEIQSLEELVKNFDFENISSTGQIKYDLEKLNWINHKWISRYSTEQLVDACLPFLKNAYPDIESISKDKLIKIFNVIKTDLVTLKDSIKAIEFYFVTPNVSKEKLNEYIPQDKLTAVATIIKDQLDNIQDSEQFTNNVKQQAKQNNIPLKYVFQYLRLALTGKAEGPTVHEIIDALGTEESKKRILNLEK